MDDERYRERVQQQIAQYADTLNIHALPATHRLWAKTGIAPGLQEVFGLPTAREVLVEGLALAAAGARDKPRFLSIGCGDGTQEIVVAQALVARGVSDFEFICADLSPVLLARFRAKLPNELAHLITPVEQDLNAISIEGSFDAVMAHQSLHHIVGLEQLFQFVFDRMPDHGIFAIHDMIGRNGHMRWPETLEVVNAFWPLLTERQKTNVLMKRVEHEFINHDCSTEGFEGIRAQDILPLLLQRFHPQRFFGFGGFIDPFIDRCFGHNFDVDAPADRALIECMSKLNEVLLDANSIKPTMMLAHFVKTPCAERCYRDRTAARSVRTVRMLG